MTAKEYLKRYAAAKRHADRLEGRIKELQGKSKSLSAYRYSDAPRYKKGGDTSDAVAALDSLTQQLYEVTLDYVTKEAFIHEEINRLDKDEKTVLWYRYIEDRKPNGEPYTWYEIAEMVPCQKRTAQNIHGRALQKFRVPE